MTKLIYSRNGQSLLEVMIGLAVGVVLIGAGTFAISAALRSHATLQKSQSATSFAQGFLSKLPAFARGDWNSIAGLSHGLASPYFLVASGTSFVPVAGAEGLLDNDVADGIVGRWGFDEAAGAIAYDMSGHGLGAALAGGVSRTTSTCRFSSCLLFDNSATGLGAVAATSSLDSPTFSIVFWVKPVVFRGGGGTSNIAFGREVYTSAGFRFGFTGEGKPMFWTTESGGTLNLTAATAAPVGVHSMVAFTYTSGTGTFYMNGAFAGAASGTYVVPSGVNFYIGGGVGGTQGFNAFMDEVRLYRRAISAAEVQRLYASAPFTRSFSVETACRTTDAASAVGGVEPCAGGTALDPSTLRATVTVGWPVGATSSAAVASTYLIRSGAEAFHQTDWSGGSGESAPVTTPTVRFASSTNADVTGGGSIRIHGL